MQFKILERADFEDYQKLLSSSSHTLFYQQLNYINLAAHLLDCEVEIHGIWDKGELLAACPWVFKDAKWGRVYNSLAYYGSFGGIISNGEEERFTLENEMCNYLAKTAVSFSYITNPLNEFKLEGADYIESQKLAQINFFPENKNIEELMLMFHSSRRRNIRKAQKEDISWRTTTEVDFIRTVHTSNMEAIGVAPKEDRFFNSLSTYFKEGKDYEIYECTIGKEKVAALLLFYHKEMVEYYMPAIKSEFRSSQALSWLIYEAMKDLMGRDFKVWNWGGTPVTNTSLHSFKAKWGSKDCDYAIQVKINDKSLLERSSQEIVEAYPGMFVAPFDMLKE